MSIRDGIKRGPKNESNKLENLSRFYFSSYKPNEFFPRTFRAVHFHNGKKKNKKKTDRSNNFQIAFVEKSRIIHELLVDSKITM